MLSLGSSHKIFWWQLSMGAKTRLIVKKLELMEQIQVQPGLVTVCRLFLTTDCSTLSPPGGLGLCTETSPKCHIENQPCFYPCLWLRDVFSMHGHLKQSIQDSYGISLKAAAITPNTGLAQEAKVAQSDHMWPHSLFCYLRLPQHLSLALTAVKMRIVLKV